VWSYDFLTERTKDDRQLRFLVVIDEFTREYPAIEVARSFTARDVIMTLQHAHRQNRALTAAQPYTRRRFAWEFSPVATRVQRAIKRTALTT
jgi:transposase InsO family protein